MFQSSETVAWDKRSPEEKGQYRGELTRKFLKESCRDVIRSSGLVRLEYSAEACVPLTFYVNCCHIGVWAEFYLRDVVGVFFCKNARELLVKYFRFRFGVVLSLLRVASYCCHIFLHVHTNGNTADLGIQLLGISILSHGVPIVRVVSFSALTLGGLL